MFNRKSKSKANAASSSSAAAAAAAAAADPCSPRGGGVKRADSVVSKKKSARQDSQRCLAPPPPEVPPGAGGKPPNRKTKVAKSGQAVVTWAGGEAAATGISTVLVAAGVSSVVAPVVAVIVLVGHVVIKGAAIAVNKRIRVRADQKPHLEDLSLTEEARTADHFTIFINGAGAPGECSAFVSSTDYRSHVPVSASALNGISRLISGNAKCNVRDMGGFTENLPTPFNVRISMPDVLALMRQSWTYERFCQTKCRSMTIVVLRSQHGKEKLRVAWDNSGSLDCTKAKVYTVEEWKKTPFAGKTTTLPEKVADVDMALNRTLVFE